MYPLKVLIVLVLFPIVFHANGTHLKSVEITVTQRNCNSLVFEITLTAYLTDSNVSFGGESYLEFGDGQRHLVPELEKDWLPSLNAGIIRYKITYMYAQPGSYILSYSEANRNLGIVNTANSGSLLYYTETQILVETARCNSSPRLIIPPVDFACSGQAFYHNSGAVDADNDSLSFELVIPGIGKGVPVTGYSYPNAKAFYDIMGKDYNKGNESGTAHPAFNIDPVTGLLTWDAPGAPGEYVLAIKVVEWRYNTEDKIWRQAGFVIRDMQVVVQECANNRPDIKVEENVCVIAGETLQFDVQGMDPDGDSVMVETFSSIFNVDRGATFYFPRNGVVQRSPATNLKFTWPTTCNDIYSTPYQVVFKITDKPLQGTKLVTFKTVFIRVIPPAPSLENISVNPISKQVTVSWNQHACENVKAIQVWRRVAKYEYEQGECESGMPTFLRYTLQEELAPTVENYVDNDVVVGALYCYRVVALVGESRTPSKLSEDLCIIPKPAEAPVITNVSVYKTDAMHGNVFIRWTEPFDIDVSQYPPPYQYKVYRSTGLDNAFELLTPEPTNSNQFIDSHVNTVSTFNAYKIELYLPMLTTQPVDTSSQASSIYLSAVPHPSSISLNWDGNTPWTNFSQNHPFHQVYRSEGDQENFELIDSVNVNQNGFRYSDGGNFQNKPLKNNVTYYYKVLTRGTYGNPKLKEPLENFSQVVGVKLLDTIPPCSPLLMVENINCKNTPCYKAEYKNSITWSYNNPECTEEAVMYKLLVSESDDGEFELLKTLSTTSFAHDLLTNPSKCYKIIAIDGAGNESKDSNVACVDNCPHFELPNVFTPNNHDGVNDVFTTYPANNVNLSKCSRFVKAVDLKIYDRWGKEVYQLKESNPESFVHWEGTKQSGQEVTTGYYYYKATVDFDVRDTSQKQKQYKGWVHVIH